MYTSVRNAVVSAWLWRVLRSMSRETMLKVLDMVCTLNPGWRSNLAAAREFVEGEHPFYQWIMAMRRDLNPLAFHRFVRNAVFANFVADRRQADYEKERGAPPLSNVVISVTERCNLRCEGCWAAEYDKRDDLPYPLLDRIVRELKEMRASFVTFTGGEPFMRADILDLMEAHPDVFFQIYTNGTLITDAMADRLAKLGNAVPLVSINGFELDNDGIRGAGNFKAVSEAFDRLKARGIFFGVSLTATSRNMNAMTDPAFYDWLIAKGAKLGWVFQYIPVGRTPSLELMISPEQRAALGQFVYALRNSRPFFIADFWNDGALVGGCMAGGKQYLHITNRGDVEPCVFCHFSVDNIREKSLHEVIRSPFFTDIRNGIPYDGNLLRPCMMVDRPDVFRSHVQKHAPRPSHAGAESLVEGLAGGLDERAGRVRQVMDRVWHGGDFASFFTFDPRWYNAIPPADARAAADTKAAGAGDGKPGGRIETAQPVA
jgi:MoaA/NifB/PqqE/SkfB family radical SAM enzyme